MTDKQMEQSWLETGRVTALKSQRGSKQSCKVPCGGTKSWAEALGLPGGPVSRRVCAPWGRGPSCRQLLSPVLSWPAVGTLASPVGGLPLLRDRQATEVPSEARGDKVWEPGGLGE